MLLKRQQASMERLKFGDLLTVAGYNEDTRLFALVHDDDKSKNTGVDLAAAWFGVPAAGASKQMVTDLEEMFMLEFPPGTLIQVQRLGTTNIDNTVRAYTRNKSDALALFKQNGLTQPQKKALQAQTDNRAQFLMEGKERPLIKGSDHVLKEEVVFVSIRVPFNKPPTEKQVNQVKSTANRVEGQLNKVGIRAKRMDPQAYIDAVDSILRIGNKSPRIQYDSELTIRDQVTHTEDYLRAEMHHCVVNDRYVRSLSAHTYPGTHHLYKMLDLFGDVMGSNRQIAEPYLATLNVIVPEFVAARGALEKSKAWVRNFAEGQVGKLSPQIRMLAGEHEKMERAVGHEGVVVKTWFNFMTFSKTAELAEEATQTFKTMARAFQWDLRVDMRMHHLMLIQNIPMGADPRMEGALNRYQTKGIKHAAQLVPLLGEWAGNTHDPVQLYVTRRGALTAINTWHSDEGYNGCIAATTGAGKSVMIQDIAINNLAAGVKVCLFDKGRSFKRTVELLGGQYFDFIEPGTYNLNPFRQVKNIDEETEQLSIIFQTMADPDAELTNLQRPVLTSIVREGWAAMATDCTVDWVATRCLKDEDKRIQDIGRMLEGFSQSGQHGAWFTEGVPLSFGDNMLTAIELSGLDHSPGLQSVVLQMTLMEIQRLMYLEDMKGSGKKMMAVIDEAADLLSQNGPADFGEKMARQARKYNAGLFVVTQLLSDFIKKIPTGPAILGNSAFKILLAQKDEVVQELKNENWAGLSPYDVSMLETVHTDRGKYSEALFVTPNGSGVCRLILSRADQLLYTTDPGEKARLKQLKDSGKGTMEAIAQIIEEEKNIGTAGTHGLEQRRTA